MAGSPPPGPPLEFQAVCTYLLTCTQTSADSEAHKVTTIREPAVAGMFYPDDPLQLQKQLESFLQDKEPVADYPKALIVPHAGYVYSGPIAASAYRLLRGMRDRITRVLLLGPAHRVAFRGLAATSAEYFSTPLGLVKIDRSAMEAILALPQVRVIDEAHREEHSLEVQLPFLQSVLGQGFSLIPLVVGEADGDSVAQVIETLWGDRETLILISSDLSHYQDYDTARRLDNATSHAIERLDPRAIDYQQACGRNPVNGLLLAARHHKLRAQTLDLRNSGDTAGSRDRVVGYGAYAFI